MIFDWDDFHEHNNNLDMFRALKEINPEFKCTVFAIPGKGSPKFWQSVPDYIELAVHGWLHPHPRESENWNYGDMDFFMSRVDMYSFVKGFKAPGWQISDGSYEWLLAHGWWVADQRYNDKRRPADLPVYLLSGDSWHGHIQNDCGNGMVETWDTVKEFVARAPEFKFVSEALV